MLSRILMSVMLLAMVALVQASSTGRELSSLSIFGRLTRPFTVLLEKLHQIRLVTPKRQSTNISLSQFPQQVVHLIILFASCTHAPVLPVPKWMRNGRPSAQRMHDLSPLPDFTHICRQTCSSADCLCDSSVDKSLGQCINCSVNSDASAASISSGQQVLDSKPLLDYTSLTRLMLLFQ